jgi:hypothetical protein
MRPQCPELALAIGDLGVAEAVDLATAPPRPRDEPYGRVAAFPGIDIAGNWRDLPGPAP